ncbi:MAG: hypothetical protein AB1646_01420 [Thermodesulfobacteriota bacterium]
MAAQYPFPFTESIIEQYDRPPVWERFAPDWTPDTGIPLHIACIGGWVETMSFIRARFQELSDLLAEDESQWAENLRSYSKALEKCIEILEELINLGMDTIPIDPVVLRAVAKARKNHRNLLHLCETAEEDCTDLPTDSLDPAECDAR